MDTHTHTHKRLRSSTGQERKEKKKLHSDSRSIQVQYCRTDFSFLPSIIHAAVTIFSSPSSIRTQGRLSKCSSTLLNHFNLHSRYRTAHKTTSSISPPVCEHTSHVCTSVWVRTCLFTCLDFPSLPLTLPYGEWGGGKGSLDLTGTIVHMIHTTPA